MQRPRRRPAPPFDAGRGATGTPKEAGAAATATSPNAGAAIARSTSADNGHSRPCRALPVYGLSPARPACPSTRAATLVIVAASSSNPPCEVDRLAASTTPAGVTDQMAVPRAAP